MTHEPFGAILERWHDYYLMVGTAAATLLGLLFVSLSFNLEILLHDSRAHLMDLARQTFHVFLTALIVALIVLIPDLTDRVCGMEFLVVGAMLFVPSSRNLVRLRKQTDLTLSKRIMITRTLAPMVASAILMLVGWRLLFRRDHEVMVTLSSVALLLLGSASGSAWDLLVRVGRARETRPRESA